MERRVYKDKYIVKSDGTIWIELKNKLKQTGLTKNKDGYFRMTIKGKIELVHRIIASEFVDGWFEGAEVDHINGNKEDNRPENLEWVTKQENLKRMLERTNNKAQKIMTQKRKRKVLWNGKVYNSAKELSLSLGLNEHACAERISRGHKLKGHYPEYI